METSKKNRSLSRLQKFKISNFQAIMKVTFTGPVNQQLEGESEEIRAMQQALEVITSTDIIRRYVKIDKLKSD